MGGGNALDKHMHQDTCTRHGLQHKQILCVQTQRPAVHTAKKQLQANNILGFIG